jgi:hypothetical protein
MALSDRLQRRMSDTNSATSVWFFNLVNNVIPAGQPDVHRVRATNAAGIAVLNKIQNNLAVTDYSSLFRPGPISRSPTLPTTGASGNFVLVNSIIPVPVLTPAGFTSAASYAATSSNGVSPGEYWRSSARKWDPLNPWSPPSPMARCRLHWRARR